MEIIGRKDIKHKKNFYKLVSIAIQKKYKNDCKKETNSFEGTLINAYKKFKQIDLIGMREQIELIKYNFSETPACLWQDELVCVYKIFATTLGYIDERLDQCNRKIAFYMNFTADEILKQTNDTKKQLLNLRNEVINNYNDFTPDIICVAPSVNLLENYPPINGLKELYQNSLTDEYQASLYYELITSYNNGHILANSHPNDNIEDIMKSYKQIVNNLTAERKIKENKIKEIKKLSKQYKRNND